MSYSCLEELQVDLDLHMPDKTSILSKTGCQCNEGWFVITDDGICHLFDKDGKLDNTRKIKQLEEKYIKTNIKKIVIPDSVTRIGSDTFQNCLNLTSVTIPDSVTSIGVGAFSYCTGLISIMIPDSVKSIDQQTFFCCSSLTNVIIPSDVTYIGDDAFADCSSLTGVTIPNSVTNIGWFAFFYCSRLMDITIPDSVTSIGRRTFEGCNKLTNMIFEGKTLEQVKRMNYYPWGIENESIIQVG